jgi:secreted trypsin-like serine protease
MDSIWKITTILVLTSLLPSNTLTKEECQCGIERVNRRIIDGKPVPQGKYPWLVMISTEGTKGSGICTGSLISDRHILTAAHCFLSVGMKKTTSSEIAKDQLKHTKFVVDKTTWNEFKKADGLKVASIKIHPCFRDMDDMAVITLKEPIELKNGLVPICIPYFDVPRTSPVTLAGYGVTNTKSNQLKDSDRLLEVEVNLVDGSACKKEHPDADLSKVLCYASGRAGSCGGDSGMPVMYKCPNDGHFYQISVHTEGSKGVAGQQCNLNQTHVSKPRLGERLITHIEWLRKETRGAKFCSAPGQALTGKSKSL